MQNRKLSVSVLSGGLNLQWLTVYYLAPVMRKRYFLKREAEEQAQKEEEGRGKKEEQAKKVTQKRDEKEEGEKKDVKKKKDDKKEEKKDERKEEKKDGEAAVKAESSWSKVILTCLFSMADMLFKPLEEKLDMWMDETIDPFTGGRQTILWLHATCQHLVILDYSITEIYKSINVTAIRFPNPNPWH